MIDVSNRESNLRNTILNEVYSGCHIAITDECVGRDLSEIEEELIRDILKEYANEN